MFFAFLSIQLSAQNITGKVIKLQNSLELSNVQIVNVENNISTNTNTKGGFFLSKLGTYTFSKEGYISKTITISNTKFKIVVLETEPESLDEIQITSTNFHSQLKTISSAISVISVKEIQSNNTINIAPIINAVPGVFMHNGALNTNRITIRGIGSRNLFGTSKIRAYYQDIQLTNG
ncbi:MAG: TonB-dependent receptor plug domain-containing protein [Flavobacteriaceae bacterium]|nr:TonB-dependent receptor plug domain-containing protein [Flavobacteriaceae bacterium]